MTDGGWRGLLLGAALSLVALGALAAGVLLGSAELPAGEVAAVLAGGGSEAARDIVLALRLPRVLAAFACGALLAVSGALLQLVLRNPLADAYVLGVSGGAASGALLALAFGATALLAPAALAGAALSVALLLALARAPAWGAVDRLLLTGVVLAAGFGAFNSLLLIAAPEAALRGMVFWLLGDLSQADDAWLPLTALGLVLAASVALAARLDALVLGPVKAVTLGVPVRATAMAAYGLAAAAAVSAVLTGGTIGFVGLVVPHALRLGGITAHRALLPLAALAGGSLVALADTAARTVLAPQQLPVGIFTALLGVPAMLWLLARVR